MRLTKYNPAQMDPAERARRFADRDAEIEALLEIIRDNMGRSSNQHVLVTGARGIGKTALLLRVVDLVRDEASLSPHWFPIVASEEIYRVSSIGEFWLEMLFFLSQASGDRHHAEVYKRLRGERNDRHLAESARSVMLDFSNAIDRHLLLVVENLQLLFDEQLDDAAAWALRETLIGEPRIMLLASAVSSFDQIENPNAALFELFLIRPLAPLDTTGCQDLWEAATGRRIPRRRMRALEILTGGNPRLLVILSEFAAATSFRQLMEDLVGLIDDHTDYLKSTTEALPAVERKVFVSLAELWRDSTAAEIAGEARLDVNTTSAQLIRLERRGAVVARRKGRGKLYRLSERLYNIYHLMRRHGDQEARVRAAVEFMSVYYGPEALPVHLTSIAQEAAALPLGERREHFMAIEGLLSRSESKWSRSSIALALSQSLSECKDIPEGLRRWLLAESAEEQAARAREAEEISDDDLLAMHVQGIDSPQLLLRRAELLRHKNPEHAIACLRKAVGISSSFAPAWSLLSCIYCDQRNNEEALAAGRSAVGEYRKLVAAQPDAFLPDLAMSLNNLGNSLSDIGCREEALEVARESVEIYRKFAGARPDVFLPDLAGSLNNLGKCLSDLGHRDEALEVTREAVEQYRKLAAARPDVFLPDLAVSLNNLGKCLSDLGHRDEALEVTRESVQIRRKLAAARPDALLADLAMSLNNLGAGLAGLGRTDEALEVTREAVDQYRKLVAAQPDAFLPDLAMLLNNLGTYLGNVGRREEAFEVTRESVEIRRKLAALQPDAFLPGLAGSLNNLGAGLADLGRTDEALEVTREAVDQYRKLVAAQPDAFLPDLAMSLNNMSEILTALDRRDEAQAVSREALSADPKSIPIAATLIGLLTSQGKPEEALRVFESVLAYGPSYDPANVRGLTSISVKLAAAGKGEQVLRILQSSAAAEKLEPLVVGLQEHLGLETLAPPEIEEVAKDIAKDISDLSTRGSSQQAPRRGEDHEP
jgi:tetratricopeptide (TPR) repeat protein